jgi:sulfane dehydrogenase subunit SoxC
VNAQVMTDFSPKARVADPGEGITLDELALAARNHALPLEALREDLTPVGMHYVLAHYDIPYVDPASWRLEVGGAVEHPISLDLAQLQDMPRVTLPVTVECAGNGRATLDPRPVSQPWLQGAVGTAEWTGVRLADLLADASVPDSAVEVLFTGVDHGLERGVEQDYERALPVEEALRDDVLVAYAMNGQPLPPQHGFPARLVVPGWYGMTQVKWLTRIAVLERPYDGYQNAEAYRLRQEPDEPGEPVTRMEPRGLLVPPGFPEFQTRRRVLDAGLVELWGRAWSGWGPVTGVQVSVDGGLAWAEAELDEPRGPWTWRGFRFRWLAEPGLHVLRVSARDATGRVQPVDGRWSRGGFANNADQPVTVLVR